MSAFEDNPFAEDDEEMTPLAGVDTMKKEFEEKSVGGNVSTCSFRQDPAAISPATAAKTICGNPLIERVLFDSCPDAREVDAPSAETLLAEYEASQEEDEFNALVVKAASLESELKKQDDCWSDELACMKKRNEALKESLDILKNTIVRKSEEIDFFLSSQNTENTGNIECGKHHRFVELMEALLKNIGLFENEIKELLSCSAVSEKEGVIDSTFDERLTSCMFCDESELPDIFALDSRVERSRFEVSEAAIAKLRSEGGIAPVVLPLIDVLVAQLGQLVARYDMMYTDTTKLRDSVMSKATLLRELMHYSREWHNVSVNRPLLPLCAGVCDGVLPPVFAETLEGALGNRQLEATLRHMEHVVHRLLMIPNVASLSQQNASSAAAASTVATCQELELQTEALGREVLHLRKLLAMDTATLKQVAGSLVAQTALSKVSPLHSVTTEKSEWLTKLAKTLTERLASAETLLQSLKTSGYKRTAPAVRFQLAFYRRYVEMQEALLRALCLVNGVLQERANLVANMRQLALRSCDDEAVNMFAESIPQYCENNITAFSEELGRVCSDSVRQFFEETSNILQEEELGVKQSEQQLRKVRNFLVDVVQSVDLLVYGATSSIGAMFESFKERPIVASEAPECLFEVNFAPCDDVESLVARMASSDHDEEIKEELYFLQQRNEELMKCLKWFSMQRFYGSIPQLHAVLKEIDAAKQKLSVLAQRDAKWTALNDEIAAVKQQVAAAQSASAAMKGKLDSLRERIRKRKEENGAS